MYIKYRNKPKILAINNSASRVASESLLPEIVKETVKFDNQGNSENILYKMKFFCPINVKQWASNAESRIQLKISNLSADDHRQIAKENFLSLIETKLRSGEITAGQADEIVNHQLGRSRNVNQSIAMLTSAYNLIVYQDLFKGTLDVAEFNFSKFEGKFSKLKTEKVIRYKKTRSKKRNLNNENNIEKNHETFRKKHNYLISQGIDPMFLFENSYKKTSTLLKKGGLKVKEPLKLNSYEKFLKEIFEDIEDKIKKVSSNNKNDFKISKITKEVDIISSIVSLSKSNLEKFGDNIHLIFIVKNNEGINLQVESVPININEIYSIRDLDAKDFQLSASRNKYSKVSKLAIGNSQNKKCSIDLYAKKVENNNIMSSNFDLIDEDIVIQPRQKIYLYDGKISTNATPANLGITKDILYRATLNFKNESYDNAKTAFSKGIKTLDDVYPTGNIVALSRKGRIDIYVSNLSDNIKALRIVKKRNKGRSFQKNHELISDNNGIQISEFKIVSAEEDTFKFEDYDVFDGKIYKYQIQAMLGNGENKTVASNSCIELYEQPQGIIGIGAIRSRRTVVTSDNGELNVNDLDRVKINFSIKRSAPEFETIVSEIFGKTAERYFENELKDLRTIESFFYSIKVEKINASTGEKELLTTLQINTGDGAKLNQSLSFEDEVRKNQKYFYKLTPRVKPTSDLLTIVSGIAESIASSGASTPAINYASLSTENMQSSLASLIMSRVADKYYTRNAISRGIITPSEVVSEKQNNDLFFDASTGDIEYVPVDPTISSSDQQTVNLKYVSSKEIKNKSNLSNDSNKGNAKFDKRFYSLSFEAGANDYFIDFYIVFIKEEDNVYLDGVVHSRDRYENVNVYKYLVEHIGTKGIVDYYIVPVTKKGLILEPRLIHKKIIG
jgi:hypothetical protein